MRRFLTTLMILLVVLVAGLSALVLLVNPNDFRDYMVKQVAARSGYQLQLDGPLRWHVWPQLSILSGRMSLTAQGASQPLVRADNMRLDVALLPLLSHQLSVKQVMLKGAVIQLTPQTEAVRSEDAPVAPRDNTLPDLSDDRGWSFDISSLKVADSVLVFQHEDDEQVTIRDAIDKSRFDVVLLGIDKQGQWHVSDASNYLLNADDPAHIALRPSATSLAQVPGKHEHQLMTRKTVSRCRRWMSFSRLSTVRWAKMVPCRECCGSPIYRL